MVPTIRVDKEVFEGLQQLAEPFVDSPNAVILRLLKKEGVVAQSVETDLKQKNKVRASRGEVTTQKIYEQHLLKVLRQEFKGRGYKTEVTNSTLASMKDILTSIDFQPLPTGQIRAENTVAWARNALKDQGLIRSDSPRGVWELTDKAMSISER